MIVTVINVPEKQETLLLVVIEKENLERMKQADPITIESAIRGGKILKTVEYPKSLTILIAYEEDDARLYSIARSGDLVELLRYLERGRKFNPEVDGKANIVKL
jgi:DNA-directed RNA polymerase subunit H (RpoH/RPB5)